jgi:AraC-like DNA-binding protein
VKTSHIIVILLTAKTQPEDQVDSYKAGTDAYIAKPFQMCVLEARLENLIQNKQKQHQQFRNNIQFNISDLKVTSLDEQFIQKAVKTVEDHLAEEDFDITAFAGQVNMSRSTLSRKLKNLTGLSPLEFIRNIKMKHARKMLDEKNLTISEVAYAVGYYDRKYFTNCFKEEFGITPSEFLKDRLK